MTRFWDYVKKGVATEAKLPLIHSTDIFHFREISNTEQLEPQECEVYKGNKLLYFFYGRPSYRPHASLETITAKAFLPVCLIMSAGTVPKPIRIMPFDTGAFDRRMMHPPIHKDMDKTDFALSLDADAPMRLVDVFYGSEREYFDAKAKPILETPYDSYEDLEVDSYFRLLHHRANSGSDDRVTAIEFQVDATVPVIGSVEAVILPKPYLDNIAIIEKLRKWQVMPITYHVREEFIPREAQGAILQRLSDYFCQKGWL